VRLLFERGSFLPSDTVATAAALQLYAVGLLGYTTSRIASPVFYALGKSRIPVLVSVVSVAVNVAVSLVLVRTIGFRGLALGTSVAALCHAAISIALLRRHLGGLDGAPLSATGVRIVAAAAVMAAAARGVHGGMATWLPGSSITMQMAQLATAIVAAMAVLVAAGKLLRIREFDAATRELRLRARKLLR
jgi:putative peptidoglycan lipid II flippase